MKKPIGTNKMFLVIVILLVLVMILVGWGDIKRGHLLRANSIHILSTEEYNCACDPGTPPDEVEYVYIVRYILADTMREVQVQTHSPEERDELVEWLEARR